MTYGRSRPTPSSSSLIFDLTPPSSPLLTPHTSSDDHIDVLPFSGKENIAPTKTTQATLGSFFNLPNKKRPLQATSTESKGVKKSKDSGVLRQMHLTHVPLLHTCAQCLMSYVRGGDDEGLHEKHHARVTRGIIWDGLGRGRRIKARPKSKSQEVGEVVVTDKGWRVIKDNVPFGAKGKGRVIVTDGSYGGTKVCPPLPHVAVLMYSWTIYSIQSIQYSHHHLSHLLSWTNARFSYSPPGPLLLGDSNQVRIKAYLKKG